MSKFSIIYDEESNVFKVISDGNKRLMYINLDGLSNTAVPISAYGLKVEDFKDIPLNKFGLKTILTFENEELVLTANGLFVVYSDGLPSLHGLPSDNKEVSGIWVSEDDKVLIPRMSVFSKPILASMFVICSNTSFRCIPEESIEFTRFIFSATSIGNSLTKCDYFSKVGTNSRFINHYPRINENHLDYYNKCVKTMNYVISEDKSLSWFNTSM